MNMNVKGLRTVVVGLGESGRAAAELLLCNDAVVTVRDARKNPGLEIEASELRAKGAVVELGVERHQDLNFDLAVISPGIDPSTLLIDELRKKKIRVIGELELAYQFCGCPVVAITGTNGKSTTTELIAAVLKADGRRAVACGNLKPAFSRAMMDNPDVETAVVEVSSFQLEAIEKFKPRVSVYLNFTPDHLDRYATLDEYRQAKDQIFLNQGSEDFAVVNVGCKYPDFKAKRITFSALGEKADYEFKGGWLMARGEKVLQQCETNLKGPHNAENQLAAIAVADILNVSRAKMAQALCEYKALPHRCEVVGVIDGVTFINDSKATNPDSLEKAIMGQEGGLVLIAGGKDKGFDFSGLRELVAKKVKHVVLIGEMKDKLYQSWSTAVSCHFARDLGEAVSLSRGFSQSGDVVLFSPGCSSYDMFKNFEDRGDQFRQIVKQQKKGAKNE
jgi:UDP-N-acetylmuramoylalanine--D-glutamate ligase